MDFEGMEYYLRKTPGTKVRVAEDKITIDVESFIYKLQGIEHKIGYHIYYLDRLENLKKGDMLRNSRTSEVSQVVSVYEDRIEVKPNIGENPLNLDKPSPGDYIIRIGSSGN